MPPSPVVPEASGAVSNETSAAPPRMPPVPEKLPESKFHSARVEGGVAVCVDVEEVVGVVLGVLVEVEVDVDVTEGSAIVSEGVPVIDVVPGPVGVLVGVLLSAGM